MFALVPAIELSATVTLLAITSDGVKYLGVPAQKLLVLLGAVMVQLVLGTVYGYSIFWQPLEADLWPPVLTYDQAASLVQQGKELSPYAIIVPDAVAVGREREYRLGLLKYSFGICLLSFAASMVVAGRLQDRKGPRFTAVLGGLLLGLGFLVAGQMNTLAVFYLCHAVLVGAAVVALLVFV